MSIPLPVKRRIIQADCRVDELENLLRRWVVICELAGVGSRPVSGDLDDNPFLKLLKDSRTALKGPAHD